MVESVLSNQLGRLAVELVSSSILSHGHSTAALDLSRAMVAICFQAERRNVKHHESFRIRTYLRLRCSVDEFPRGVVPAKDGGRLWRKTGYLRWWEEEVVEGQFVRLASRRFEQLLVLGGGNHQLL